ncbi:XapX domain-containing protein, partial [Corallococcus soli]
MKIYLVSMAAGTLMGVLYALFGVRSPAPPLVALAGLLGILVGEQLVPVGRKLLRREPLTAAWLAEECVPKVTGVSPSPPGDAP